MISNGNTKQNPDCRKESDIHQPQSAQAGFCFSRTESKGAAYAAFKAKADPAGSASGPEKVMAFADASAFDRAISYTDFKERQRAGIGTLAEKTVHAVLKNYFEPDPAFQEVRVHGYVADICKGRQIIEIQSGQFGRMRNKLNVFLQDHDVTIVYPAAAAKYVVWIDPSSKVRSKPRKSPRQGNIYDVIEQLYQIKMFLDHPNLQVQVVFMDLEEHRLQNGRSRNGKYKPSPYDRYPRKVVRHVVFDTPADYLQCLPDGLPDSFTTRDFAQKAGIPLKRAQMSVHILHHLGLLKVCGKQGAYVLYQVSADQGPDFSFQMAKSQSSAVFHSPHS